MKSNLSRTFGSSVLVFLATVLAGCGTEQKSRTGEESNDTSSLDPWPDLNDSKILDAILEEAIDRDSLWESNGQFIAQKNQAPYDGWGKGLYPDGQPALLDRYKDGKLDGQTFWFENGRKKSEGRFQNGDRHGVWIEWNEDGTERRRVTYPEYIESE